MAIFNFFGNIFGYLLWLFYEIFHNYGIAIIFFTLVTKLLMIPFSIKQQKSMASQMKMAARQRELQQKYANDRDKMNAELQKLYQKENYNPMGGCATSLLPFPIMIGIYYSVIYPLQNTLHLAKDSISNATAVFSKIPGVSMNSQYLELEVMRHFPVLKDYFVSNGIFNAEEVAKIENFSDGFHFLGMDMLAIPQQSSFASMLWVIPVLCLVSYFAVQWISQKMSGQQQQQQGCMKIMFIALPLFSAYWAYIMPAAVGLYWVVSSVLQIVQTIVLHKMYSPAKVAAYNDAAHLLLMEEEEAKVKPLPKEVQDKIAEKLAPKNTEVITEKVYTTNDTKKKKSANKSGKSSDYMGAKK